ncbi:Crp/Fnr family transcriptional regulator [Phaeodactylibacter sp.]|jgi:CRP-like cAMP-binding protein|uniref:Crp/Fnr family transcriptional regulator n=1 Tax=Phaeodactylibacter sp. TaxID=1940289 RepID=UPI0025CCFA89|nr:Crp/Fnr family transcriptional regulator [Phaeodactylibacter sp.]MCI4651512.1 Crp/Fnr family transcriptional regulator [Phaeodactylibacter sp.]MCI5092768.1 Crp/Fnr family transcriptional regulator [Phaeodactylibacter sp.]
MQVLNDYTGILNNIKRYVPLNEADERQCTAIVRTVKVKKRQFIVQPGFVCSHQTYVKAGAFRSYFLNDDGVDHTIQFAIEDWFISDFNSYINQVPASLFVEALEDSTIQQIAYQDVEQLCNENPKFERFFRLVAQKSFAFAQRRVLSNLGLSAEERYLEFQQMYPSIVQRVPQYALASYLGMSAEFLSKIRSKLASKS